MGTRYLTTLMLDSRNNLWIGTWGKGVFRLNLTTSSIRNYPVISDGFGDNKVFCFYEDRKGTIWLGSAGSGLFVLDKKTESFVSMTNKVRGENLNKTTYITSILEDGSGTFWLGTLFGLYSMRPGQNDTYELRHYLAGASPGSIGSNGIQTLMEDSSHKLWIGTSDAGVSVLSDPGSGFRVIGKREGLLGNWVMGMLEDEKGNLWLSGSTGISRYDPVGNTFSNYTTEDGLPSNEFNLSSCFKGRDGTFYFGSDKGLLSFHPDSIRGNPVVPVVRFTDLKLNNQSARVGVEGSPLTKHIDVSSSIELPYSQRSFAIDFVAINYGQSSRNQYCYMLKGFDDDWNCVGSNHSATYTNLDAGSYTFLVKATNSDGVPSTLPARLEIIIRPAPWKTWWAYLGYTLVVSLIIYFLMRVRVERLRMKSQIEFERLAREKEHELSESKTQFFTAISHELRTPLSLIAMPLENLLTTGALPEGVRARLGTIQSNANKLMTLVNELLDFNKLENAKLQLRVQQGELVQFCTSRAIIFNDLAERRNIHFGIHSMVRSIEGWFDHDKMEKILVNVLSNAFKFTRDNGQINVVINVKEVEFGSLRGRCLELAIIDNGIGISTEELPFIFDKLYQARSAFKIANPGTGIGLSLTKGLVELHHGRIEVSSTPDRETKFLILIPIDKAAYPVDDVCEVPGYIVSHQPVQTKPESRRLPDDDVTEVDHDRPQVLIVEDNDELRKYMTLELGLRFSVLEASNGKEGLELALERSPDLIISDILMPEMSGIELCREIKSNLKTSHIPFIMLTAKATVDDQVAGLATGADVYLTKPFSIRFLFAQVNQIVESRQRLYSRFSQDVYLLPGKVTGNEIDKAFLQKAIDYIIKNIQDPQLGVDAIADLFNLSRMQVYRKIKALTGKTVVDFIRMVRMKQALTLMDSHKYTLSEIAFQTGFNSSSYFTRVFKDQFGKTPSEYLEKTV